MKKLVIIICILFLSLLPICYSADDSDADNQLNDWQYMTDDQKEAAYPTLSDADKETVIKSDIEFGKQMVAKGNAKTLEIIGKSDRLTKQYAETINSRLKDHPDEAKHYIGKHKELYEANKEGYRNLDWEHMPDEFKEKAAKDIDFVNAFSPSEKWDYFKKLLGTGQNWEYGTEYIKALLSDKIAGLLGDDLDFSSVSPIDLQAALNAQGYGITSLDYPQGSIIEIQNDELYINGNRIIDLEKLKTGSYAISVDSEGNVQINDVSVSDATLSTEGQNIFVYDGAFATDSFVIEDYRVLLTED